MSELAALQARFAAALRATQRPAGGMSIYHSNLRANFRRALQLSFPVLERLVGIEYFDQLAMQYMAREPSRSGDLHHVGAGFCKFVVEHFAAPRFATPRHAVLADVAVLEWAWQECFVAADAAALDPAALGDIPQNLWPRLRFEFHPACRMVESRYPVLDLWRANGEPVALDTGSECLALSRPSHEVRVERIAAGTSTFLRSLRDGADLARATDLAAAHSPDFDLLAALSFAFRAGMITQCAAGPDSLGSATKNT